MAKSDLREQPVIVIIKKRAHHGHHGGAWKVAFADFMTAMMAMFLVLWIVSQSTDVKSAIAGYFQDPLGRADQFGSSIIPGPGAARPPLNSPLNVQDVLDPRMDRLGRIAQELQNQIASIPELEGLEEQVDIELTDDGLKIHLLEDSMGVFFERGGTVPAPRGQSILRMIGRELGQIPNHIVIEGHTDAQPFASGSRYSNWELSTERANAARRVLIAGGLADVQVNEVRGLADREPRVPDDPFAPENRRVTITVEIGLDVLRSLSDSSADSTGGESAVPQLRFLRLNQPPQTQPDSTGRQDGNNR
jgi:chemotaxis protein MotB